MGAKNLPGVLAGGAGLGAKDELNPNLSTQQKWAGGAGWNPRPVLLPEVSPGKLLGFFLQAKPKEWHEHSRTRTTHRPDRRQHPQRAGLTLRDAKKSGF